VLPGADYSRFQFAENSIYRICFCGENVLSDDFFVWGEKLFMCGLSKAAVCEIKAWPGLIDKMQFMFQDIGILQTE